jgi:hypothetical protein
MIRLAVSSTLHGRMPLNEIRRRTSYPISIKIGVGILKKQGDRYRFGNHYELIHNPKWFVPDLLSRYDWGWARRFNGPIKMNCSSRQNGRSHEDPST